MRVPDYMKSEYGSNFSNMKQKWEAGRKEALAAIEDAVSKRPIKEERKQTLIMGTLRRTAFTGGWRNQVKDSLEEVLRLVSDFSKAHPGGCNQNELDTLVEEAKGICGTRIESVITRFLCDLKPDAYLPLGGFTNAVLTRVATILEPELAPSHRKISYEEQLTLAKQLASHLEEAKVGPNLYVFDHFLAWFNHLREETVSSEDQREPGVNYWVIAPGEGARLWSESIAAGTISLGWDEMGDLSTIPTLEAVKAKFIKLYQPDRNPKNKTLALYDFAHSIKPGDIIFAKEGTLRIVGMGKVTSDYIFDPSRSEQHHVRKVDWTATGIWDLEIHDRMAQKSVTNVTRYSEFVNRLLAKVKGGAKAPAKKANELSVGEPYSITDAQADLFMGEQQLSDMLDSLQVKQNIILQGPPGVGKTFVAERLAMALTGTTSRSCLEIVQFHPSYSYEDFVQGYRPNGESFELKDGLFVEFCDLARRNPETKFVMIIDEINRGNLSKIFGELLMLIEADKRNKEIKLTYSSPGERFSIPQNLFLIGTMNTADRSLSLVDYALRRRFAFFDVRPAFESPKFEEKLKAQGVTEDQVRFIKTQLSNLNLRISQDTKYLGMGFEIGHSYFCSKPTSLEFKQWYLGILKHEIAPLLREYWFDDADKADREIAALKVA